MESFFEDTILYISAGEEKRVPGKILIAFVEAVSFSLLLSWDLASSAHVLVLSWEDWLGPVERK